MKPLPTVPKPVYKVLWYSMITEHSWLSQAYCWYLLALHFKAYVSV